MPRPLNSLSNPGLVPVRLRLAVRKLVAALSRVVVASACVWRAVGGVGVVGMSFGFLMEGVVGWGSRAGMRAHLTGIA